MRIGWPLATKSDPFKVIERPGEGPSWSKGITPMEFLVKLGGAMGKNVKN